MARRKTPGKTTEASGDTGKTAAGPDSAHGSGDLSDPTVPEGKTAPEAGHTETSGTAAPGERAGPGPAGDAGAEADAAGKAGERESVGEAHGGDASLEAETEAQAGVIPPSAAANVEGVAVAAAPEPEAGFETGDSPSAGVEAGERPAEPRRGDDDAPEAPAMTAPPAPETVVVQRKGGTGALVLGGALAALIGFGVARYVLPEDFPVPRPGNAAEAEALAALEATVQQQAARIDALEGALDAAGPAASPADLEALGARVESLEAEDPAASAELAELAGRLDELAARLETVERAPMEQALDPAVVDAYEREMAALRADMDAQRAEIEQIASTARAEIEAARSEAAAIEAAAEETARAAVAQAALTRIRTALDSGSAYAGALADLADASGLAPPEALAASAESGVQPLAALQDSFPEAARAALAAAREGGLDAGGDGAGRFVAFLRAQTGARSVAPREGDDPDAILSRAEAALRAGDLGTALEETAALPEPARDALGGWRAAAQARADALAAADALEAALAAPAEN